MLHCQVTYKVFFGAQSLPLVLVEKGLQEVTGGHRPTPGDLQRLVQNVLIHLGYVLAVEGRLVREGESWRIIQAQVGTGLRKTWMEQSWVAGRIQPDLCFVQWLTLQIGEGQKLLGSQHSRGGLLGRLRSLLISEVCGPAGNVPYPTSQSSICTTVSTFPVVILSQPYKPCLEKVLFPIRRKGSERLSLSQNLEESQTPNRMYAESLFPDVLPSPDSTEPVPSYPLSSLGEATPE